MSCQTEGFADMYGAGIRVGFYLQWFGSIIAEWLSPDDALGLRFANSFFTGATLIALIFQTSSNSLTSIDVYVVLLLTFGAYYYLVPLWIWRAITCFNSLRDPSRWTLLPTSVVFSRLTLLILLAVSSYQIWFWSTGINQLSGPPSGCPEYGFFFAMIPLNNTGFIVVNILLNIGVLLVCLVTICLSFRILEISRSEDGETSSVETEQTRYLPHWLIGVCSNCRIATTT